MSEDPSATYRGFRKQALYALHRLLIDADASERIYRPEGSEDLAVFDSKMRLMKLNLGVKELQDPTNGSFCRQFRESFTDVGITPQVQKINLGKHPTPLVAVYSRR